MNPAERERYSRQILFAGIGESGQEALLRSHAVIVGCGALGSFHAAALARAGVGALTIIDRDYVEPSNLHRQWLFEESDAAEAFPKAAAAQVADALQILCGPFPRARITPLDLWSSAGVRQIDAPPRDPNCPCCARREFPYLEESSRPPVTLCGRDAVQVQGRPLDLAAL